MNYLTFPDCLPGKMDIILQFSLSLNNKNAFFNDPILEVGLFMPNHDSPTCD